MTTGAAPRSSSLALALTALLVHGAGVNAWWLLPVGVIVALGWSLRHAVKS